MIVACPYSSPWLAWWWGRVHLPWRSRVPVRDRTGRRADLRRWQGRGKSSQTGIAADLVREEKSYKADATLTTPLGLASRQALQEAVVGLLTGMPKMRWSARVVDVRNGVVYVGATGNDGMQPGLELEVYEAGEALVDPATGQSLGAPERFVGTIVIETVLERFSTAKIVGGEGLARGHVVRLKGQTPH